jgi:hypothetical protein
MNTLTPIYAPSLLVTEIKRHKAVQERNRIHQALWIPIYNAILACKTPVFGYGRNRAGSMNMDRIITFTHSISSFTGKPVVSHDFHNIENSPPPDWILTRSHEELGLLINQELSPEAYQALKDRLSDVAPQTEYRQDLCDRYMDAENKLCKINELIGTYNETIEKYISHKMYKDHTGSMKLGSLLTVCLHINSREYHWLSREQKDIFLYPESEIIHIYEADILQDEANDPGIHGVKFTLSPPRPPSKGTALKARAPRYPKNALKKVLTSQR